MRFDVALLTLAVDELERAAAERGTPVVLVDEQCLGERWQAVRSAMVGVELFFPYKSCPLNAVRRRLASWGAGAEVASPEELEAALDADVPPRRILLNQPLRNKEGLARAVAVGALVVADGLRDVERAGDLAGDGRPVRLLLRINPGVGAPVWSRFGLPLAGPELFSALRRAGASGVDVLGLHAHIGTNVRTADAYGEMAARIAAVWAECEDAYGGPLEVLDFGGGFATPAAQPSSRAPGSWHPDPPEVVLEHIRRSLEHAALNEKLQLWAEPGRLLVEDAGVLLTRVVAIGETDAGPMVTCDAGANLLPTAGYIRHRLLSVRRPDLTSVRSVEYDVFGPLCMQSDVLAVGTRLPADLEEGDLLAVGSTGGYDLSFSFPFIVGRCAVLLRSKLGELRLIRRREEWTDLNYLQISA